MAQVTVGRKPDGSPDRMTKYFAKDEKELARQWIADQVSAMGRGTNLSARNTSWKELQDQWLATKKATVSEHTYQKHDYASRHIPWTSEPVRECVQKVQQLMNEKSEKMAPATLRDVYAVARGVLEIAIDRDIIYKTPRVRLPKMQERVPELMSFEQIAFLLQASERYKSKYRFGLWLELGSGLRRSEMLALDWSDVDWNNCSIAVNKSLVRTETGFKMVKKTKTAAGMRTIDVPALILDVIKPFEGKGKMFETDAGNHLSPWNWSRLFRSWRTHADTLIKKHNEKEGTTIPLVEEVRFHDLRHQFASFMHQLGVSAKTTQQMTGHKDIPTLLQRYTHITPIETKAASEKLNELLKPLLN